MRRMNSRFLFIASLILLAPSGALAAPLKKLSFLLTNDLHGHLEPRLPQLSGLVKQLRAREEYQSGDAALFVLDSGDQFQGTLLSNHDEGESMFRAMNAISYDAVVPGNHDYDFGPIGWLYDRVQPGVTSAHPREVIERLAGIAEFPLLSANTYLKESILAGGIRVPLDDQCRPSNQTPSHALDFTGATRPSFLQPFRILEKAGVRVALIGLDHPATASTTTRENVSDLCFRDPFSTYLEIRDALEGKADVYVLLIHEGNSKTSQSASELARKINEVRTPGVHLVAAGHTHFIHDDLAGGIHVIQDGANARAFGRVDLYFEPESRRVIPEKTDAAAGIPIDPEACDSARAAFVCRQLRLPIESDPEVTSIVTRARERIAPLAGRVLGRLDSPVRVDRISESALGNLLSDALREATGTEVALLNTGGIRAPLAAGEVRYEDLFQVLPFQNQVAILERLPWPVLREALSTAIRTCGRFGTLAVSGLRIRFTRTCSTGRGATDVDPEAKLLRVETASGRLLYDLEAGYDAGSEINLRASTLDFIAAGGSGYGMFTGVEVGSTPGINRELIVETLVKNPDLFKVRVDGRFKNVSGQ